MSTDRLAIVGGRRFADVDALAQARLIIAGVLQRRRPDVVISGGAEGIDGLAAQMAREAGIEVIEHLPRHRRWEPEGYKARNDLIADDCTRLLRIGCRWASSYGSGYTHDRAKARGRLCWNVVLPMNLNCGELRVITHTAPLRLPVRDGRVLGPPPFARKLGWTEPDADVLAATLVKSAYQLSWAGRR